uniref:Reverse transcriptase Ty1/copia-type domain-containing protein n=1 Tax=Fagus sylvatica TaxID=28930 RepID=A0A2N9ETD6_FAGSY
MPTSSPIITPMSTPHNNDPSPAPITSFSDPISPHSAHIPLSNDHVSDSTSSSLSPQSKSPTLTVPVSASVTPSILAHMLDSMSTLLPVTHSSSGNTHPMTTQSKAGISKKKKGFVAYSKSTLDYLNVESPSYSVACTYSQWRDAMAFEFQALQRQSTWTLVPSSPHFHVIGCHWVFKIKRNPDGSVARYKARLVAKGNHQQAGIDYDETFSPVVKPATVRLVLSLAAQNKWSLRQLDVSNAFLHGALKERVYMRQPTKYALDILTRHNMSTTKPCSTPFVSSSQDSSSDSTPLSDPYIFRSLVEALQYLTFTRPNLSYAVNSLCQHMHSPSVAHLVAAKRVLRYSTVACSSTEAEYWSLVVGATELAWLQMLLCDFGIFLNSPPIIWCDNLSAISLASNPVFHARTKHVEIDYHFVRECVIRGDLKVQYIPIEDQLADLLTKALPSPRFLLLSNKLLHSSRLHAFEGG